MARVPAAAQTLAILRYLSGQAGPVPAGAITRDLHLSRSTTYHLLATLQDEGFVVLYVIEERARGRQPLVTDVDVRLPAHLTASGARRTAETLSRRIGGHPR